MLRPRFLHNVRGLYIAAAVALAVPGDSAGAQPGTGPIVKVIASDHSFRAPDTVPAGLTRFQMQDLGPTDHQLVIFRIADSVSLNEFYAAMQQGGPSPAGIRSLGGAQSGEEISLILEPGRHVLGCMHGFEDGTNHLGKGMFRALTVVANASARQKAPDFDATISMDDYGYETTGTLTAGRKVLRIVNKGPQEHHILLQKLVPGRTLADVVKWQAGGRKSERPVFPVSWGTTRQSKGAVLYATIDLEPGGYVLLCRVPDAHDGKPHVEHGMRGEFRVSN